jgi:gamma-glutamyltranspeptidase/glutathione hydrolase
MCSTAKACRRPSPRLAGSWAAPGAAGHDIELTGPFDEVMGHAGAVIRHPSGLFEGAADPRSDGAAAGF